jgi:hypothetical protein
MRHPQTRGERRLVNKSNQGHDFRAKWSLVERIYTYKRWGWWHDRAKRDHEIKRCEAEREWKLE